MRGGEIPFLFLTMEKLYTDFTDGILSTVFHDRENDTLIYDHRADVSGAIEDNKRKQNMTGDWKKFNPNQEYHMVLDLTMIDVMTLKNNEHIDIMADDVHWPTVFKLIDTKYPYMKTTTAKLA